MGKINIQCYEQERKIKFILKQDQKTLFEDQVSIDKLIFNQNKEKKYKQYFHNFLQIHYWWNCNIRLKAKQNNNKTIFDQIYARSSNRIVLQNIYAQNIEVKSRSLYLEGSSQMEFMDFAHQKENICDKLRKNIQNDGDKQSLSRGRLKITQNAKIKLSKLKIKNSDLIIYKNAELNLSWNNGYLNLEKTNLMIQPYGTLCTLSNLAIKAYSIQNRGKIKVKSDNQSLVIISQKIRNTGHIKINSFAISTKALINEEVGKIQGSKGVINLIGEGLSQNKGNILTNQLQFVCSKQKVLFINQKNLTANIIKGSIYTFQNSGNVTCNQIQIEGMNKNSFVTNQGIIIPLKIFNLSKIHLINSTKGKIQTYGNVHFNIQAWINQGNMNSSNEVFINSNGLIKNKGVLIFNKSSLIKSKMLSNQNQFEAKNAKIQIQDTLMNEGNAKIQNSEMISGSLTNLKDMQLKGNNVIVANIFNTKNNFGFGQQIYLKGKQIYFDGNIITAKKNQIQAKYMSNRAKTQFNQLNFKGEYLRNQGEINIKEKGKILVDIGFSHTKYAKLNWKNVEFQNKNQILNLEGEAYFKNPTFKNIKDVYGTTKIIFQDTKQQFRGIHVNNLQIKNAHLAGEVWTTQGQIVAENGGIYQGQLPLIMEQNQKLNKFIVQVRTPDFYKNLKIVLKNQQNLLVTSVVGKYLNGMTLLQRPPIILGNFHHHLICDRFQLPEDKFYYPVRKGDEQKMKQVKIPRNGQKSLQIEAKQIQYRGKLVYDGNGLKFKTDKTNLKQTTVSVPNGILSLESKDSINLVKTYLTAKGITLHSQNQITTQAVKFVADLQGILMQAKKIKDRPNIIVKEQDKHNGEGISTRIYQVGIQSKFTSQGNIVIRAEQYIHLVAPVIEAKKCLWINSPNTLIHGIFLMDKTRTIVQKDTVWGGTKTNTYQDRNDKPLPTKITADKIYIQGNAKINATFKANQLYDLTKDGVQLFFVIGYTGSFQNRQFCNFATQGVEGRNYLSQKLLRANLKEVAQIIRPLDLPGHMKFNTVQWDKTKTKIVGHFKQTVYKTKSWSTEWHHETISKGMLLTIGIAASFIGANFIAPYFTAGLQPLQIAMVKAGFSTLTNKLAVALVGSGGDLSKAFSNFFSSDTLKALVFNVATAGITGGLTKALGISTVDANNNPIFSGIFKQNLIKHAVNISADAVINGNLPKNLQQVVTPFVVDVFGQYAAGKVGQMYLNEDIGYLMHKGIHGVIGGIGGFLTGKNLSGIVSGSLAAIAAEVAMQAMVPIDVLKQKSAQLLERVKNGQKITGNQIVQSIQKQIAIGKIIGMVVGGVFGKNWDIAKNMAANAVDHNWVQIAIAIGHFAFKSLTLYMLKKGYDKYIKPSVLSALNISDEQKAACDEVINMLKDGSDIFKSFKAYKNFLAKPPTNMKQAFAYQIQNYSKLNPMQIGTKIARFQQSLSKITFNKATIGYMCAGLVQLGLFHNVDQLIGSWKSFTKNDMTTDQTLKMQAVGVGVAGIGALGALDNQYKNKKYSPKQQQFINKSPYQIQQNMINFGMKKIYRMNDNYNQIIRPKDLDHYDKINNLKVIDYSNKK